MVGSDGGRRSSPGLIISHVCSRLWVVVFIHVRSVHFRLPAVTSIHGQWHSFVHIHIRLWTVMFVHGWSCLFMGGCIHVRLWVVLPLVRCGGGGPLVGGGGWSWWRFIV